MWGILNVKLKSYTAGPEQGSKTNLSLLKTLPWWIKSTSKEEESQLEDTLKATDGQPFDLFYLVKEIQFGDHLKVNPINKLLLRVPLAKEPRVHIDPVSNLLLQLFKEKLSHWIPTEFTKDRLA